MKKIKQKNDFVLALMVYALSAFLGFANITESEVTTGQGGLLARTDVWLRMIAVFMAIVATILVVRSLGLLGKVVAEKSKFTFYLDGTIVGIMTSLILYALALDYVGFFVSTFSITFYLVLLFSVREQSFTFRTFPKKDWPRLLLKGVLTAVALLVMFWLIFGKLLAVQLPTWELF